MAAGANLIVLEDQALDDTIDAALLKAGSVTSAKLASGAAAANLAANEIVNSHLADNSVDSAELAAGAVDGTHLAAGAVDSAAITAGAIDGTHLANGAVDSAQLASGSIDGTHFSAGAVDSTALAAGSVDSTHLAGAIAESNITFDSTNGHNHNGTNSRSVPGAESAWGEPPDSQPDGTATLFTWGSFTVQAKLALFRNGALQSWGGQFTQVSGENVATITPALSTDNSLYALFGKA